MENYNGLCEPTEHCYHEGTVGTLNEPPQLCMICCDCGHIVKKPMASYIEPNEIGYFQ